MRGSDRALHHQWQTSPGGGWSGWGHLGGTIDQIAITQNASGGLELFTVGTDHGIWRKRQVSAGGCLESLQCARPMAGPRGCRAKQRRSARGVWTRLRRRAVAQLAGDAVLKLRRMGLSGRSHQSARSRTQFGRTPGSFHARHRGLVHHKWQVCAGCGWTGWTPLPRLNPPAAKCWNDPPDWFGHKESPSGARSDPINLIVCFDHGRTWDALFAELTKIKSKTLFGQQYGFDRFSTRRIFRSFVTIVASALCTPMCNPAPFARPFRHARAVAGRWLCS